MLDTVCKPVDAISDWVLTTTLGWSLVRALIWIGVPVGFWAALWFFWPSVVLFVVAGLPVAAGVWVACSAYRRGIAARRHLSFRVSQLFGVQV
jgi:hypothetical protein